MPKIFIITGVPGTGKTTLLRNLSKNLSNATFESSNKIAKENNLFVDKDSDGSFIINLKNLKESINFFITQHKTSKYIIIEGHLLSDIKITNATVIVLRSHLKVLENRLKKSKRTPWRDCDLIFMKIKLCHICGKIADGICSLCGRPFCKNDAAKTNVCSSCASGRR